MSKQGLSRLEHDDRSEETSESASSPTERTSGMHLVRARAPEPTNDQKTRSSWSVVQEFAEDGFLYRLVRRPVPVATTVRLTKREQQALAYARDGHSNKFIAAALGIAPSTIGVLLFRAAAKMGVKSRRELLIAYSRLEAQNSDK
jgi:DNA-binding CsgD family transcriptional regulator